jgi:FAD:protein FMN transferase
MEFKHVCLRQRHMATTFSFTASVPAYEVGRAERVLEEALALVGRLESELTEFRPTSPVYRFNNAEVDDTIQAPASLIEILELSRGLMERTSAGFHAFAKSRLGTQDHSIPPSIDFYIEIDTERNLLKKKVAGAHLSFGAIGKGFALDKVRLILLQAGLQDFVLNAGGSSIVISGFASPDQPWDWAWSWQRDSHGSPEGLVYEHRSGELVCLGVSGLHEQGEHILDARSGLRSVGRRSALVAHSSAAMADGLSTAFFVLGWEQGLKKFFDPAHPAALAMIDGDGCPLWNGEFQAKWGPAVPELQSGASGRVQLNYLFLTGIFFLCSPLLARADGDAVDLSALGISTFTPYIVERNSWWIALPVILLLVVSLHLPFPWNARGKK